MKKTFLLLSLLFISISAIGQGVSLKGRSVVGALLRPTYNVDIEGKVVVAITVDQYGKVTEAVPGVDGTTVTDQALWAATRKAAMESHFNQSNDPNPSKGTITYNFIKKGSSSSVSADSIDESAIIFMGIPIDGNEDTFISQLKDKGFKKERNSDEYFSGQFNGEPVRLYVHTYHNRVDRIIVEFEKVPEMNLREQYNHLLSLLKKNGKYEPQGLYSPILNTEFSYESNPHKAVFSYMPDGEVWLAIISHSGYCVALYYDNLKNRPHGEDL